ncbi:hypothetical protein [Aquimarina spongiae]|uniref:Uncharacterized protein n=1 Tax=Aquimarina spongiae TaxID=570521 RepID=A0A1M6A1L6_9FLAO|nr:hypothetical protein [Aquimarina spongiae]SHI30315.1 hypothetical protein SAMN04488508_10116 [Aquimarina spongiae]
MLKALSKGIVLKYFSAPEITPEDKGKTLPKETLTTHFEDYFFSIKQ